MNENYFTSKERHDGNIIPAMFGSTGSFSFLQGFTND